MRRAGRLPVVHHQYLEPCTPIYVEDIEAWLKKARLKIQPLVMRCSFVPECGRVGRKSVLMCAAELRGQRRRTFNDEIELFSLILLAAAPATAMCVACTPPPSVGESPNHLHN